MKSSTPDLLKFKRLQRRLGVSVPCVCGLLELLWISTSKNAPQGDIGRFTNEEIAIGCYWDGDPDLLVESLLECGWLDSSEEHRLVVHDWAEHCPAWVKGNLASQKKEFVQVAKQGAKGGAKPPAIAVGTEHGPPSGAPPSQAKPSQAKPSESGEPLSPPTGFVSRSERFNRTWDRWKRHLIEKGKPITPTTEEFQLMDLARCYPGNEESQIAAIEFSISRQSLNLILNGDHQKVRAPQSQNKPRERDPSEVPIMSQPGQAEGYAEFVKQQEARKAKQVANG